jgi:glycosyltransferase involved in cell wall biosynthesis
MYVKWLNKTLQNKNIFPIFVSKSLRQNLLNERVTPKNEGMVLYTGIDLNKFKRTNYKISKDPVFLQVSNFNDKKGQQITIEAFKKTITNNPTLNARLIFIGDGANLNICKKLVTDLQLSDKIKFLGNLDHLEIINHLNFASVFVHHSITAPNGDQEGIPNVILEAMAMELPILSTYHSGIPEAVEHQINGLLCKENDIETYSKQMEEISNWELLNLNRKKVFQQFNIESHIEKLNTFYNLIGGN